MLHFVWSSLASFSLLSSLQLTEYIKFADNWIQTNGVGSDHSTN